MTATSHPDQQSLPGTGVPARGRSSFAVVTVSYFSGDHLRAFVASLGRATTAAPLVVIADNAESDDVPAAVADEFERVHVVRTGANIGYGGAVNRAVAELGRLARTSDGPDAEPVDFVVVANPDVVWGEGSLDALLAAADRWPRAGSLGPLIREPDGTVYPSARRVPDLVSGTGHALLGAVWKSNPWTASYRQDDQSISERSVGWLSGSCLVLRRSAFESVNGFDSRYFMYMEDVDLGDRLATAGWLNVYVPDAEIVHDKGHSAGKHPELMLPAHHRSAYRFQADRHPHAWQAPLRWALRAGLAMRSRLAVRAARRDDHS